MNVLRTVKRSRQSGATISLVDNRDGSFDNGGYAWITYCETHGSYCEHQSRALASSFVASPAEWCESCAEAELDKLQDIR